MDIFNKKKLLYEQERNNRLSQKNIELNELNNKLKSQLYRRDNDLELWKIRITKANNASGFTRLFVSSGLYQGLELNQSVLVDVVATEELKEIIMRGKQNGRE